MSSTGETMTGLGPDAIERVARDWIGELVSSSELRRLQDLRLDVLAGAAPGLVEALAGEAGAFDADGLRALSVASQDDPAQCVRAGEMLRARLARELAAAGHYGPQTANGLASAVAGAVELVIAGVASQPAGEPAQPEPAAGQPGPAEPGPARPPSAQAVVYDEAAAVLVASEGADRSTAIGAHDARERSWENELDMMIDRHGAEGLAFALIAAQIAEARLVEAADGAGELERLLAAVDRAICAALPAARTVRAPAGRMWMVVPAGDDREAARSLRVAGEAAAEVADRRGEPVMLDAGYALCPSDGQDPDSLRRQAELSLGAAGPRV